MNFYQLETEYSEGLGVFFNTVQGSVEEFKQLDPWRSDTHSLALKMFRHLGSIRILCQTRADITPGSLPSHYIDFSSAQIICRAAIETFLMFSHVFAQKDLSLSKFRYEIWQLSGLADRQKYQAGNADNVRKLESERKDMEQLRISIAASPHLKSSFTDKQAQRVLAGGWSQLRDWKVLSKEANIHPAYFDFTYSHLSGFSHSSFISALQISQARDMPTQTDMACFCLQVGLVYLAHFLVNFSLISESAIQFLKNDRVAVDLISKWHITHEDWENIYKENQGDI